MDKGEGIMPVPQGVISTSEGPVDPEVVQEVVQVLDEAIVEADAEEAVEEYLPEIEQDDLL
jgi:ABC-type nitrate/sulfonate/bicarbonate transport system substrate-binding protein